MKIDIEKKVVWNNRKINYFLRKSKRAKKMRIELKNNSDIFLIIPKHIPNFIGITFLKLNLDKIIVWIDKFDKKTTNKKIKDNQKVNFQRYKKEAEEKIKSRVKYFSRVYNFSYNQIKIKDNKTNWGSCSTKKNLNFNYRLIFLKKEEMDYIIIHELFHLREMNHSKKFWGEVEKIIPNYKDIRQNIKKIDLIQKN